MSRTHKRSAFAAGHQRSWLWGRHAVLETLQVGRWPVLELFASEELHAPVVAEMQALASQQNRFVQIVSSVRLRELCQADDHQGFLIRLGEFPCRSLDDLRDMLLTRTTSQPRPPLFVICDRIQDAHNFGAILRSCDAMAVDGVIVSTHGQCRITPHVARSSAGAVNHLTIYEVPSLLDSAKHLTSAGIQLVAASEKARSSLWETPLTGPVAIVIGTEATGIAPDLLSIAESVLQIPMLGRTSSLNAAVAAGILLTEIRRQHHTVSKNQSASDQ